MRPNRLLPALAGLFFLSSLAGAAGLTPEGRARARRVLYELREAAPLAAEAPVPLGHVVRGYGLVLEGIPTGVGDEAGYWRRAAKARVQLAKTMGSHLHDLDRRVAPSPLPIEIRTKLRRVAARLQALTADGGGDLDYWRSLAQDLEAVMVSQALELHEIDAMLDASAPDRALPAHLSLYYLSVTLRAVGPSGEGFGEPWRRCAEDQVALARRMGLAVANYVRAMQQPVRRLLLEEAAALRSVKLGEASDPGAWQREANRLAAVLESHAAVLRMISEELR